MSDTEVGGLPDRLVASYFLSDIAERKLPHTKGLDITSMLVDSATTGEWNLQGLPTDDLSIQNGILTTRASRYPIMVDPQGQGLTWIRNKEQANGAKETSFQDRGFRTSLEDCMGFGKPLLLANVENELDPVLDPILDKSFIRKGKTFIVALADKECDIEPEKFTLYITTRLSNPHFTPELSARVTIIDFTVTIKGLEDQLLARVVLQEKPELEQERQKLQAEVNGYQKKIVEVSENCGVKGFSGIYGVANERGSCSSKTTCSTASPAALGRCSTTRRSSTCSQ